MLLLLRIGAVMFTMHDDFSMVSFPCREEAAMKLKETDAREKRCRITRSAGIKKMRCCEMMASIWAECTQQGSLKYSTEDTEGIDHTDHGSCVLPEQPET